MPSSREIRRKIHVRRVAMRTAIANCLTTLAECGALDAYSIALLRRAYDAAKRRLEDQYAKSSFSANGQPDIAEILDGPARAQDLGRGSGTD